MVEQPVALPGLKQQLEAEAVEAGHIPFTGCLQALGHGGLPFWAGHFGFGFSKNRAGI